MKKNNLAPLALRVQNILVYGARDTSVSLFLSSRMMKGQTVKRLESGSVAYCQPCFREVMEEQEKIECSDSNELGKNRDLQKQEEWCSTKWKSIMA